MKCKMVWIAALMSITTSSFASLPQPAVSVDTVRIDLNPLIDRASHFPQQFAVNVPHSVSSAAQGHWSTLGAVSTWTYSVRVPTAISVSFHASGAKLPSSAVLTVAAAKRSFTYTARDVNRSGIWGRPMPGDSLTFSLSVASSEVGQVRLQIDNLQAGYRSLGAGVPDHPHYLALRKAAASESGSCTENYSCHVTAANQGPSHATVALIISNLYQCTGTLLNDTSADGIPYVLTARHCENGHLGGGNPDADASVAVYWDAISPCGSPLGSLYESTGPIQTGTTTVLEQQDLWLIRLNTAPASGDAFFAGWDASGSTFAGGYTIHQALGQDQQYVAWSGTDLLEQVPASTLNIGYDSTFWGVVNGVGNVGAGASGSALFSPNNLAVGAASLAALTNGENSSGVCPVSPPPAPSPNTVTALFTSLSAVWTSTADKTSSTPGQTLKSLLDAAGTGKTMTGGIATQPITLTASSASANTGTPITLSWNVAGAQSCTAWGGTSGDGWAGARASSGSVQLTSFVGGNVNYSLNCLAGGELNAGTATVEWNYIPPTTGLTGGDAGPLQIGSTTAINWMANVGPCVASGGTPGDGWAGPQTTSGSYEITITQAGVVGYTLTCGPSGNSATNSSYVYGVAPPQIWLTSTVSSIIANADFELLWSANGNGSPCTPSGGSGSDGWTPNAGMGSGGSQSIRESVPGTYTFTVTCTFGGQTATSSQTVVVTSGAPVISLTPVAPQQQIESGPQPNLYWTSNAGPCFISIGDNGESLSGASTGVASFTASTAGPATYTLTCGSNVATATIDWVTSAVPNALSTTTTEWAANVGYPISWSSSVGPCTASGGGAGDGWAGSRSQTGSQVVSEAGAGGYLFTLVCGSGASATTSQLLVEVPPPIIQINPVLAASNGLAVTQIGWRSGVGPCTYVDGSASNSAGQSVAPFGSSIPTPTVAGTYLFTLTCGSGAQTLSTATLAYVTVNAPTKLAASAASVAVNAPVTLTWSSGGGICYATGGDGNAPWVGTLPGDGSGSLIVTAKYAGSLTYAVTCNSQVAQVAVAYTAVPATSANAPTPTVKLSASAATQTVGQSIDLSWSSKSAADCAASGGDPGDGWSGTLAASGSMTVTETTTGSVTYSITCAGAPPAATASTTVVISAKSTGSSGGGGGALDILLLLGLLSSLSLRSTIASTDGVELPHAAASSSRRSATSNLH
jgi:hypothetical protein